MNLVIRRFFRTYQPFNHSPILADEEAFFRILISQMVTIGGGWFILPLLSFACNRGVVPQSGVYLLFGRNVVVKNNRSDMVFLQIPDNFFTPIPHVGTPNSN